MKDIRTYDVGSKHLNETNYTFTGVNNYIEKPLRYNKKYEVDDKTYSNTNNFSQYAKNNSISLPNLPLNNISANIQTDKNMSKFKPVSHDEVMQGVRDTDMETSILRGMPSNTSKSYGYRNPEEHYYEYVDPRYTNMELFPRQGISTRLNNKKPAKEYKREIF